MSGIDNDSTHRLQNAEQRLALAIGRLEAALEVKAASQATSAHKVDPALAQELSRLQGENGELRALVGSASERLDGAIAKLKTQLAG
ncbi:MAG: hypothetical protein NUV50_12640 [Rhodospirillales bacterium]|nr:hypothetical protein [Rhodospirillales bacterium]